MQDSPADNADDTTQLHTVEWKENLKSVAPEYVSEWDEFKNSDSPEKFFDQIKNHRSMLGQSIRVPGEDAGEEAMKEFYGKLQAKVPGLMPTPDPEDADSYNHVLATLGKPDKTDGYNTEGIKMDAEELGELKQLALDAGLTRKQFKEFTSKLAGRKSERNEALQAQMSEDQKALRGEWGTAFEQRAKIAANVALKTGAPENLVKAIGAGEADSGTMRWLYSLAEQFGGETLNFSPDSNDPVATPGELQGQIDDIMNNSKHPYWQTGHPGHKAAVDKMVELQRRLSA